MRVYHFIKEDTNEEFDYVIMSEKTEIKPQCECYDRYGQVLGCYNAGCYSLDNSAIWEDVALDILKVMNIEEDFSDLEYYEFMEKYSNLPGFEEAKEETEIHYEIECYNYWDGHNYKTLIVGNEHGDVDLDEVDEDTAKSVIEEYETVNNYCDGATKEVETENYEFFFSSYQDFPYWAGVFKK